MSALFTVIYKIPFSSIYYQIFYNTEGGEARSCTLGLACGDTDNGEIRLSPPTRGSGYVT